MDAERFDRIATLFAGRRLSRRTALASGGAGLAALPLAVVASRRSAARDAAARAADGERSAFLFVQTFAAGTWAPNAGEEGGFLLTLTGHAAQTVYFSDRPDRIVGVVPTPAFLAGLGFTPANPPNAALVARTDAGEDVVVVELLNPRYTETFGAGRTTTLSYDVRVLADYGGEGLAHLAARQIDQDLPESFGPASLFIDDCSDQWVTCCAVPVIFVDGAPTCGVVAGTLGPVGFCWEWGDVCCHPCEDIGSRPWADECNARFPEDCDGFCAVILPNNCW